MEPAGSSALLLVLAGPAGSGKSTLCHRLVAAELGFRRVATSTTRAPREGEIDGLDYHFFSSEEFEAKVAAGEFLEWAYVHGEHGNRRYGTLASTVLEPLGRGQDLVISIDVQGVAKLRQSAESNLTLKRALVTVFVEAHPEWLAARMRHRGTDDEAEIARRLASAKEELREAPKFDYIIRSGTRDEDFAALIDIVEKARRRAAGFP